MEGKKDNQGQADGALIKDTISIQPAANNLATSHPFIVHKSGKVSAAAYLITEHLPVSDPVRGRIRECSIELIKDTHALDRIGNGERLERFSAIASRAAELSTLFELAFLSRLISEGNHTLINRELASVRENALTAYGKPIVFSEAFFAVEVPEPAKKEERPSSVSYSRKGHDADVLYKGENVVRKDETGEKKDITKKPAAKSSGNGGDKDGRLETILKLIRKDKTVSIKDIVSFFSDVGEKTIQRDLAKLVGQGLIVKTGEKRWSRYSLKVGVNSGI